MQDMSITILPQVDVSGRLGRYLQMIYDCSRLTSQTRVDLAQQLAVKFVAAYVVLGFFVMEILYFAVWCRPFHDYWAVPEPNSKIHRLLFLLSSNSCSYPR